MFRVGEEAARMARLFPVLGAFVASGHLDASYGVAKLTAGREPGHTTVWAFTHTRRAEPFTQARPAQSYP